MNTISGRLLVRLVNGVTLGLLTLHFSMIFPLCMEG
jgi:hypothetical protein